MLPASVVNNNGSAIHTNNNINSNLPNNNTSRIKNNNDSLGIRKTNSDLISPVPRKMEKLTVHSPYINKVYIYYKIANETLHVRSIFRQKTFK